MLFRSRRLLSHAHWYNARKRSTPQQFMCNTATRTTTRNQQLSICTRGSSVASSMPSMACGVAAPSAVMACKGKTKNHYCCGAKYHSRLAKSEDERPIRSTSASFSTEPRGVTEPSASLALLSKARNWTSRAASLSARDRKSTRLNSSHSSVSRMPSSA